MAKVQGQREVQNRWTEDELLRVRTCWSHGQRLLVQENERGQCTQEKAQERQRQGSKQEQCERSHDSNGVSDDSTSGNFSQSNLENHPGRRHMGPSRSMDGDEDEDYEMEYIMAAIRNRGSLRQSKDWYVVHLSVDKCAHEHVCSPHSHASRRCEE